MTIIFALLIGFVVGIFFMGACMLRLNAGDLRIDSSDEDGPYLFLELRRPVGWLREKSWVLLRINDTNFISTERAK